MSNTNTGQVGGIKAVSMTQTQWVFNALKRAPITAMDALDGCGCFRLAARINDLRLAGHDIETKTVVLENGKHVAQYNLKVKT